MCHPGLSSKAYVIPILFLGKGLGSPLIPLTIENHDFTTLLGTAANDSNERQLLTRWYQLDEKSKCYRFNSASNTATLDEMTHLHKALVDLFPIEMRDTYLTTIIEQEINEVIFTSQAAAKKAIWVHTGALPTKNADESTGESSVAFEVNRSLVRLQAELKNQVSEKSIIRIPPTVNVTSEQLTASLKGLITSNIDAVISEHSNRCQIPYCTFGVNTHLLEEIEIVKQHSLILSQSSATPDVLLQAKK